MGVKMGIFNRNGGMADFAFFCGKRRVKIFGPFLL
jgi:hypothetical protein